MEDGTHFRLQEALRFADALSAKRRGCSWVYFIQANPSGAIKIGLSRDDCRLRLGDLQVGHHEELTIIGLVAGNRKTEREWQGRFARLNIRGEWFRPTSDLLEAIYSGVLPLEGE